MSAAFPLLAVPLAWYVLGVVGASLWPTGRWAGSPPSRLDARASVRGAAIVIVATWVGVEALGLSGRATLIALGAALVGALAARAATGRAREALVPTARDLPMLALATVLLTVWAAPVTRHGLGAVGTGNHYDLPSYLVQAGYLFRHGVAAADGYPGLSPADRMFDAFGASALLGPSTALSAAPTAGMMVAVMVGAVLVAQLVDRLASAALRGRRPASLLIGGTLLVSWAFTFNAFAFFLAQVWGLALGLGLIALVVGRARGVTAATDALLLSVAGVLAYNPTGAIYGATALLLAAWWARGEHRAGRPARGLPGTAAAAGIVLGGLLFVTVWAQALDRLVVLGHSPAGSPMPTAPLWAALGLPFGGAGVASAAGLSFPVGISPPPLEPPGAIAGDPAAVVLAGSAALALVAAAGWALHGPGRAVVLRAWPLALPAAFWLLQAVRHPGSYVQWKAFSYAQPLLAVAVAGGLLLLAERLAPRVAGRRPPRPVASAAAGVTLLAVAVSTSFWPRDYFAERGCCIATGAQIDQIREAAAAAPGPVLVDDGSLWVRDLGGAVAALSRPSSDAWARAGAAPIGFDAGARASLEDGRFLAGPTEARVPAARPLALRRAGRAR